MNGLIMQLSAVVETGWSWLGAGLGVLLLAGATLIVAGLPMSRVPTLDDRLEPYLRDTPRPSSLLAVPPPARGPCCIPTSPRREALSAGSSAATHLWPAASNEPVSSPTSTGSAPSRCSGAPSAGWRGCP